MTARLQPPVLHLWLLPPLASATVKSNDHCDGTERLAFPRDVLGLHKQDFGSVNSSDQLGDSYKLPGNDLTLGINEHLNPTELWYVYSRVGTSMEAQFQRDDPYRQRIGERE